MRRDGADVAIALDYYAPYVSGLTECARIVAEGLVERGLRVVVVASRHDDDLPPCEVWNGVEVIRTPVLARVRKGIVSPTLPIVAAQQMRRSRVGHLHLPMIEAGLISRLVGSATPLIVTYQCDVVLDGGVVSRLVLERLDAASRSALRRAKVRTITSLEYAESSRVLAPIAGGCTVVPPPCLERLGGKPTFRQGDGFHVGFLGRIVAEKGIEHLVRGFRAIDDPSMRLLLAGDHEALAGGSVIDSVRREVGDDKRITLLGFLSDDELADLYASIDVFVLPSVSSLEAFGIVQVEAMLAGVPVIASDRPGVRVPVAETGFGWLVPPADPFAITAALLDARGGAPLPAPGALERFTATRVVDRYVELIDQLGVG